MNVFSEWRNHIARLDAEKTEERKQYSYRLTALENNYSQLSWFTRHGEIIPLVVKRGYTPISVYNWSKEITTSRISIEDYPEDSVICDRSCVFILGGAGAGKSSIIKALFHSIFFKTVHGTRPAHPYQFQFSCDCGAFVALGKYGPFARCGLDSITDKGSDFVQRYVIDSWFDPTITNLFVEGLYISYPAVYRLIRQCQARFFRRIYVVFLDASEETLINHQQTRTAGLRYTRKEIVEMKDTVVQMKHLKSIISTWEGLKVFFKDDGEVIRGDIQTPSSSTNLDGTYKQSRHFHLLDVNEKTEQKACEELLSFCKLSLCKCVLEEKIRVP